MSRLTLRGIQNREAVEEDLRANKQVMERQIKQVTLMGEQMKPATTDEVILGDTIEKFVNAMLNKLENISIVLGSFNEQGGIIEKAVLRKELNIASLIVDWNMIARSYINPANTKKQRDTIIQTILKLEQPVNSINEQIVNILNDIEMNFPDLGLIVEPVRLLVKIKSLLDYISNRLESQEIRPIQKNDIENNFLSIIKNNPFLIRLAGIQGLTLFYGRPLQGIQRQLVQQELEDPDEEDAEELGVQALNNEEQEAVDFNMPVLPVQQEREQQLPEMYEGMFGYGRKNRNQRIKFMPGPLDYNYERNDPYGNYRIE